MAQGACGGTLNALFRLLVSAKSRPRAHFFVTKHPILNGAPPAPFFTEAGKCASLKELGSLRGALLRPNLT